METGYVMQVCSMQTKETIGDVVCWLRCAWNSREFFFSFLTSLRIQTKFWNPFAPSSSAQMARKECLSVSNLSDERINTQHVDIKVILSGGRENDGGFRFSKHSFKNLNALTLSSVHSQRKLLISCNHEKKPKIIPIARENRVIGLKIPLHHFKARVLATSTMDSHYLCRNPLQRPLKKLS